MIEGFQQVRLAQRRLRAFYMVHLPVAGKEGLEALQEEVLAKHGPELKEARERLYLAVAVARLTLSARLVKVLDDYEMADAVAAETSGLFDTLEARRIATDRAFTEFIEGARGELKL